MNLSPLAYADSLRIGTIDFVSPDEIKVLLELDAPDAVALNAGSPRPFPRVNGYVLIPSEGGHLVGQLEWITVERSPFPKRKGMQDFGLVDLPYPLRRMSLNPLGCLRTKTLSEAPNYEFQRGVQSYPTVGQPVLLPTEEQLRAIIESGKNRRVKIGISPLAANAEVRVDPDRLFGRHLAVLGNTGSGKSCSVAGLIRWSLEAAKEEGGGVDPNARFIVLDPNGEYATAFQELGQVRRFAVEPGGAGQSNDATASVSKVTQLQVPLWFWNSEEWCAFTQAAPRAQRPVLIQALRAMREGALVAADTPSAGMRRYLRIIVSSIRISKNAGDHFRGSGTIRGFRDRLDVWARGLRSDSSYSEKEGGALKALAEVCSKLLNARQGTWPSPFTQEEVDELLNAAQTAHSAFGGSDTDVLPIDPDIPRQFTGDQLLRSIEANAELLNVAEHVETMLMRVRALLSDARMKAVIGSDGEPTLCEWLSTYIGDSKASNGSITIIDLSLVPAEVVHVVTAVIARMTLEALQRYRKGNAGKVLPTVLVMEEAHGFVKRHKDDAENQSASTVCCQVFEKIAREGRKFGLGLVLSSQRPSELSPTVLSQCNTFLLHRISNDRDQDLVHKLVPDNLRGLLRDLPSLPARQAILLGWASEVPTLVEMNYLPKEQRPQSDDPDFWAVWSGRSRRDVDWKNVATEWQQYGHRTWGNAGRDDQSPPQSGFEETVGEPNDDDERLF